MHYMYYRNITSRGPVIAQASMGTLGVTSINDIVIGGERDADASGVIHFESLNTTAAAKKKNKHVKFSNLTAQNLIPESKFKCWEN